MPKKAFRCRRIRLMWHSGQLKHQRYTYRARKAFHVANSFFSLFTVIYSMPLVQRITCCYIGSSIRLRSLERITFTLPYMIILMPAYILELTVTPIRGPRRLVRSSCTAPVRKMKNTLRSIVCVNQIFVQSQFGNRLYLQYR